MDEKYKKNTKIKNKKTAHNQKKVEQQKFFKCVEDTRFSRS